MLSIFALNRLLCLTRIGSFALFPLLGVLMVTSSLAQAQTEPLASQLITSQSLSTSQAAAPSNSAVNTGGDANAVSTDIMPQSRRAPEHIRQDLVTLITSDDYATAKEVKKWQRIPQSKDSSKLNLTWLEKLLRFLLGSSADTDTWTAILSLILKTLLVVALIAFIVWVARRAGYLSGLVNPLQRVKSHRSQVEAYSADALSQSWTQLPDHDAIPHTVQELLEQKQLAAAASVMYRGAMRWLALSQDLYIAPATTELQCIEQIKAFSQQSLLGQSSQEYLYISEIIKLWVQAAYDKQKNDAQRTSLQLKLRHSAERWTSELPLNGSRSKLAKRASSMTANTATRGAS
ncbi:hypothetical protein [Psychrobacter pygoscelis]|uniref:hypothetical protein n=1 Tax=Psychrobacter pygoscelis TaxID=2488563 RepID=UPI00103BAB67|nr:hypothetical protein [Psychrobacter pygoscelis]